MSDNELTFPFADQIPVDAASVVEHAMGRKDAEAIYESLFGDKDPSKVHLIGPASLKNYEVHINPLTKSHMAPDFTQRVLDKIQDNHKLFEDFSVDIIESFVAADDLQRLMSYSQFSTREYLPMKGELMIGDRKMITWPMNLENIIGLMIDANSTISLWYISEKAYNTRVRLWRGVAWALPNMYKDLNVLNIIGVQPEEIYYGSDINLMVDADDYTPKEDE